MQLGEVYRWETDQVVGHDKRPKLQIFICPEDEEDGNFFLFINSREWYKDHKLLQANRDSHIVTENRDSYFPISMIESINARAVLQPRSRALIHASIRAEAAWHRHPRRSDHYSRGFRLLPPHYGGSSFRRGNPPARVRAVQPVF